ncbi:MAG TPA: GNAT family N-acetyltransferase [Bryobacteraceae bacterium]|nr:GNAT family N-acetyltransferase [Bryobacteraceae bacterium]
MSASPSVELVPVKPEHAGELGRICYEAFKDIADRHAFPPDIPSVQAGRAVIGMLASRPDFYRVAAMVGGELAGSNYLSLTDQVAGVGPITIDCAFQGQDIGRKLMQAVIDYAREHNISRVRLLQDGFNMASLSLYASLGFDTKHAVAYMRLAPAASADASVRPVEPGDLDTLDALCRRNYRCSRKNELAAAVQAGLGALARERNGRLTGYLIPGIFGHGVAETEDDAVAIAGQAARLGPPYRPYCFCPLDQGSLFRAFLGTGARTVKVMNLMTIGPYEAPQPVWMPSVMY